MHDEFLRYVDERLSQWADWYSRGNESGLGYPSSSIEHRLMIEGVIVKSTVPRPLFYNEEAEEIEAFVVEMKKQNEKMALALRGKYFGSKTTLERARQIGLSSARFRVYVDMARQWLAGRLSA